MSLPLTPPLSATNAQISKLTRDVSVVTDAIAESSKVSLSSDRQSLRPNVKAQRTTIILRELPDGTDEAAVRNIFEECGKGTPKSVRSDVGNTWFVTMPVS